MKIIIDTNVIISALYNSNSKPAQVLMHVSEHHSLVLCDYIIEECYMVVQKKFPHKLTTLNKLLTSLSYELIPTPRPDASMIDPKDTPILNAAIFANLDMLISGDNHFLNLNTKYIKILNPTQYLEQELLSD
jgi:putative PIN family toxin of toxin-antitoxin system